jgi:hypothetical protein
MGFSNRLAMSLRSPVEVGETEVPLCIQPSYVVRSGYSVSLVIVMTQIGLRAKRMNPDIVHALVGAALLSLLLYPTLGGALLSRAGDRVPEAQMRV